MPSLPEGWEDIAGGVRQVHGTTVLRAVYINEGELFNMSTNGKPSLQGIPISVVTYLMRVE